jgi:hypothetical protein
MFAQDFYATTYRNESPGMRALFARVGFVANADPSDPRTVIYTASLADTVRAGEGIMAPPLSLGAATGETAPDAASASP